MYPIITSAVVIQPGPIAAALAQPVAQQAQVVQAAIVVNPAKLQAMQRGVQAAIVVHSGYLTKRALVFSTFSDEAAPRPSALSNWKPHFFTLKGAQLTYFKDDNSSQSKGEFLLTPECSVYETNLRPFAFKLVTPSKVLHIFAADEEDRAKWIDALKKNIHESTAHHEMDPVQEAAHRRAAQDDFYDIVFATKTALGMTLEQHAEWGFVKLATGIGAQSGIEIGSVLTAVNGESVILKQYSEAASLIKGWEPPLTLRFRRAPIKQGALTNEVRGPFGKTSWKARHFVLSHGTLQYFTGARGVLKGEFPLVGSAVSMLSKEVTKKDFCFKLVSGLGSLVLRGMNHEDTLSWCSALYHAITISNGGGYILEQERQRLGKKEEELRLAN
jgi:hypothetical protein